MNHIIDAKSVGTPDVSEVVPRDPVRVEHRKSPQDRRGQYDSATRLLRTCVSEEDIQLPFQVTISHLSG